MGKTKTKCPSLPLLLGSTQQNSNMAYLALNSLVTSNYLTIKDSRGKSRFGKKLLTLHWLQRTCKYVCSRDISLITDFKGTLHEHWEHKQVANSHPLSPTPHNLLCKAGLKLLCFPIRSFIVQRKKPASTNHTSAASDDFT